MPGGGSAGSADQPSPGGPRSVHLVRHAKAFNRRRWTGGDDVRRPLNDDGRWQAESIADWYDGPPQVAVGLIISSVATRCLETISPLAVRRSLTVDILDDLAEGSPGSRAIACLVDVAENRGGPDDVVACSHGDVIFSLLLELMDRDVPLSEPLAAPKGSTWELAVVDGAVKAATFRPPPSRERS